MTFAVIITVYLLIGFLITKAGRKVGSTEFFRPQTALLCVSTWPIILIFKLVDLLEIVCERITR